MNKRNYATKCKLTEIIAIATLRDQGVACFSVGVRLTRNHILVGNRKVLCRLLNSDWWSNIA